MYVLKALCSYLLSMKHLKRLTNLSLATAITIVSSGSFNLHDTKAIASEQSSQTQNSSQSKKLDFSGDGRPGKRTGGGSRSLCHNTSQTLTALVPNNNTGTTTRDRPSFWFYVPHTSERATTGEFVLQDEGENDLHRQTVTLPQTSGLVSYQLPAEAPPLAAKQSYRWYFKLYCHEDLATANYVEGWITKVPLSQDLENRLQSQATPDYREYSSNAIWFDSLDNLAQLRLQQDSPQLKSDWHQLLSAEGVKLEELIQQPLLGSAIETVRDK